MGANIPLPALNVRPPEQSASPLDMLARALQVKILQQQQQVSEMDLQDRKTIMDAYREASGDLDKTIAIASQKGVSNPAALIKLKEASIQQQQQNIALLQAKGTKALQDADMMVAAHDEVAKLPEEQRPAAYQQKLAGLAQAGVDVSKVAPQYDPQTFDMLGLGVKSHKAELEKLAKQEEIKKTQAQTREATATAQVKEAEAQNLNLYGPQGPAAEAKYQFILRKLAAKQPVSQEDLDWARGHELANRKTTTASDTLGVTSTSTSGPSGLAAVGARAGSGAAAVDGGGAQPQSPKQGIVDEIGNYKMNVTLFNRMLTKHPEIIGMVRQKYPDFDQTDYNLKNKAMMDLAPNGTTGKQVTSYNTFLRHAGDMWDAIDELKNSGFQDWNKPMNWLAQHTGDPRVQKFMAKMQPVQKEFQSFLIGNHALYEDDRKDAQSLFDVNSSPEAMRAVLQSLVHTGGARLSETNNTFKRATGKDIPNLVSSEAANAYNKITSGQKNIPQGRPVYQNGKLIGYTMDGKTMTPAQ